MTKEELDQKEYGKNRYEFLTSKIDAFGEEALTDIEQAELHFLEEKEQLIKYKDNGIVNI